MKNVAFFLVLVLVVFIGIPIYHAQKLIMASALEVLHTAPNTDLYRFKLDSEIVELAATEIFGMLVLPVFLAMVLGMVLAEITQEKSDKRSV